MSSAGQEAVELAASAGLVLDEWQAFCLQVALSEAADGRWAAFEVGLIVPRQNGKGSVLEARELAGLFLFGEDLILHSAHEFKTAAEAFRRVLALVDATPDLRKRVKKVRTSHGDEGIELVTGQRLRFVARSTGSGRGFSGDVVILDEAYRLPPEAMGALLPTMSARPNPQLWYASSAGHADSDVLRSVRERGIRGDDPRLCYLEWSADPSMDPSDQAAWSMANPAMGIRIWPEHVEREFAALTPVEFRRERLGVWDQAAGVDGALNTQAWADSADVNSRALDPVAFGVDVSPDGSGAIAAAGLRTDGLLHVEVVEHRAGTQWMAQRLSDLVQRWHPSAIVLDMGAPVAALVPEFERLGVQLTKIVGREVAQSAVGLASSINQSQLRHLDQADLNSAVSAARRRNVGDLWAFGRRGSSVDISPLVAVQLAAWGHAQHVGREPQIIDPWSVDEDHP